MAHITDAHLSSASFRTGLTDMFTNVRVAIAKRREFNTTFAELNNLTDRELADLGISRSAIKGIAMEAAYS